MGATSVFYYMKEDFIFSQPQLDLSLAQPSPSLFYFNILFYGVNFHSNMSIISGGKMPRIYICMVGFFILCVFRHSNINCLLKPLIIVCNSQGVICYEVVMQVQLIYCHTRPILESQPSWKSLTSLSLQDGPQSGIIISLDPTHPPIPPPTPNSLCLLIGISQQVLVGSSQNLKLKHRGPNGKRNLLEMKKTSNGRQPQNIKKYLNNHLLDLPQLLNLSLGNHIKMKNYC